MLIEGEIMDFIHGFLHRRKQRLDPLKLLVDDLIAETIEPMARETAEVSE